MEAKGIIIAIIFGIIAATIISTTVSIIATSLIVQTAIGNLSGEALDTISLNIQEEASKTEIICTATEQENAMKIQIENDFLYCRFLKIL